MSPGRSKGRTTSQRTDRSVAYGPRAEAPRRPGASLRLVSGDFGGANLAEANGEQGIEERGGRHECPVGALAQHLQGALDRRDAADGENHPIPGSGLAPREHLGDLPGRDREGLSSDHVSALAAGPLEGGGALVVEDASVDAVNEHVAVGPRRQTGGRLVEQARGLERSQAPGPARRPWSSRDAGFARRAG